MAKDQEIIKIWQIITITIFMFGFSTLILITPGDQLIKVSAFAITFLLFTIAINTVD